MYRIMVAQSKRKDFETLYKYLTTSIDGVISPIELNSKDELDAKIEKMLNDDGYAKDDFIVVKIVDYTIDATSYTDDTAAEEPSGGESE